MLALWGGVAAGQTAPPETTGPVWCDLPAVAHAVTPDPGAGRRAGVACAASERGVEFDVTYTGFSDAAQAAFQAALDTWACLLRSDQPVRVAAEWTDLAQSTLGSAGPRLSRNFDGAPARDTWYPAALADRFAGRDLNGDQPDIEASFNRDFPAWHLGPGPPPEGSFDFYTVVLHEIAHGLGFIGGLSVEDGLGVVGRGETAGPFAYDLYAEDREGVALLDTRTYPDRSAVLAGALTTAVQFDGAAVRRVRNGPAPLYAPGRWTPGGSYSHLDEDAFEPGTRDGLMSPFISRGETVDRPGNVTCAVLADIGWGLAGACLDAVGPTPPERGGVEVVRTGPNPFRSQTSLRIQSAGAALVQVSLLDARGRRVADLGRTALVPDRLFEVLVDGSMLATGVYVVDVRAGTDRILIPLTVVR